MTLNFSPFSSVAGSPGDRRPPGVSQRDVCDWFIRSFLDTNKQQQGLSQHSLDSGTGHRLVAHRSTFLRVRVSGTHPEEWHRHPSRLCIVGARFSLSNWFNLGLTKE